MNRLTTFLVSAAMFAAGLCLAACATTSTHASGAQAAASARAYANSPQFKHDEALAKARTAACVKTNHTPTSLLHCVVPKGTTTAVAQCVTHAVAGSFFHPLRAAEAALPRCVAIQETK